MTPQAARREQHPEDPLPSNEIAENPERFSRRVRLKQRKGVARQLLRVVDAFEAAIARASLFGDPPIYDNADFPWVARVESQWRSIRAELDRLMERRAELASFHEITSQVRTITRDESWKTYFLAGYGMRIERAERECPKTVRILDEIPGMKTAMFSILSPGKHIPPHRGPYNGVLRFHLGLQVPREKERCLIQVGDRFHVWEEGKGVVFDDTFIHQVWNDTDEHRVVLFVDFVRPLRGPLRLVNDAVLRLAQYTPLLREAKRNQQEWERRFGAADKRAS